MHITHNDSHFVEWENVIFPVSQGESQLKREHALSQGQRETMMEKKSSPDFPFYSSWRFSVRSSISHPVSLY